jgi:hypothetical protein
MTSHKRGKPMLVQVLIAKASVDSIYAFYAVLG